MIKGVDTEIGGTVYTVPPLSLGAIERFAPLLKGSPGPGLVIDMTLAALKRNYPEMTREIVGDMIDTENAERVFNAIAGVSQLVAKDDASGEARPAGRRRR